MCHINFETWSEVYMVLQHVSSLDSMFLLSFGFYVNECACYQNYSSSHSYKVVLSLTTWVVTGMNVLLVDSRYSYGQYHA